MTDLNALVLVGTLKPWPSESSSRLIGQHVFDAPEDEGVSGEIVRVVDHDVRVGALPLARLLRKKPLPGPQS